jgi:hypothetical protein
MFYTFILLCIFYYNVNLFSFCSEEKQNNELITPDNMTQQSSDINYTYIVVGVSITILVICLAFYFSRGFDGGFGSSQFSPSETSVKPALDEENARALYEISSRVICDFSENKSEPSELLLDASFDLAYQIYCNPVLAHQSTEFFDVLSPEFKQCLTDHLQDDSFRFLLHLASELCTAQGTVMAYACINDMYL